jgi:hypothetical protein
VRIGRQSSPPESARRAVDDTLVELGSTPLGDNDTATAARTWAGRLARAALACERSGHVLLIDPFGMDEAGIGPQAEFPEISGVVSRERGLRLLRQSRLSLLADTEIVLLTSSATAARLGSRRESWDGVTTGWLNAGDGIAAIPWEADRLVPVRNWRAGPKSPWSSSPRAMAELPGWGIVELPAGVAPWIVSSAVLRIARWGLFLVMLVLAARCGERRRWMAALAGGLFAAMTLLAPPAVAFSLAGGFQGVLAGLLIGWLWRLPNPPVVTEHRSSVVSTRTLALPLARTLTLILAFAALPRIVFCDDPLVDETDATSHVHQIIVPVDDPDQPVDPRYYLVPETLLRQLEELADKAARRPVGWMIERSTYRGNAAWDAASRRLSLSELRADFDLHVFAGTRRVELPLVAREFLDPPVKALLDGSPVPVEWDASRGTVSFQSPGPGAYRIELNLRPNNESAVGGKGVVLSIPAAGRATLDLAVPAEAPPIEIASSRGGVLASEGGRRLLAELGPTEKLRLEWRPGATAENDNRWGEAEELLLLRIQPGSVVLHARFKLSIDGGSLRSLRLSADPRLRVLPMEQRGSPVAEVRSEAGNRQLLELIFARPQTDSVVVDLQLLLTGETGLGHLRLPALDVLGARSVKRFLAVTADHALLAVEPADSAGTAKIAVPDFAERWGDGSIQPQLAWRIVEDGSAWSIATRPAAGAVTSDQEFNLLFDTGRVTLHGRIDLQSEGGTVFQRRIAMPVDWVVDDVRVSENGAEATARWHRDATGTISLFLNEPAAAAQQIQISAHRATSPDADCILPAVAVEAAEVRSATVQVFRSSNVVVSVADETGMRPVDLPASAAYPPEWGRMVGRYEATSTAGMVFRVAPNSPRVRTAQFVVLNHLARGGWTAEVRMPMRIDDGFVDELRFDVPREWSGPFEVEPPGKTDWNDRPGAERRQLVVRPRQALQGDVTLVVRGPLQLPPTAPVRAPDPRWLGGSVLEEFILLPARIELRQIGWETRNLLVAPLPDEWSAIGALSRNHTSFRVVSTEFSAQLKPNAPDAEQPEVLLSDIHVARRADGSLSGLAVFDLAAGRKTECELQVPEEMQLVQVRLDGGIVIPAATHGPWRVPLSSGTLSQRLEVAFARPSSVAGDADLSIEAPSVVDWETRRSLWTVVGTDTEDDVTFSGADQVSDSSLELLRLESYIAEMEEVAAAHAPGLDVPAVDLASWFRPRARRAAASLARLKELVSGGAGSGQSLTYAQKLRASQERLAAVAENLGVGAIGNDASQAAPIDEFPLAWHSERSLSQSTLHTAAEGRMDGITLLFQNPLIHGWRRQFVAACGALACGALAAFGLWRGARHPRDWRATPLLAIAAGVVWWLWSTPSALGLILVVIGGWRLGQRYLRASREAPSAVVELTALHP